MPLAFLIGTWTKQKKRQVVHTTCLFLTIPRKAITCDFSLAMNINTCVAQA
jgi:hypothetical protein